MNKSKSFSAAFAGAMAFAAVIGTSAFAESRHQDQTWRGNDRREDRGRVESRGNVRSNERVTMEGHITSMSRERDGYRVNLDRGGYSYWVPESRIRNRRNDFRVGISVRLGGIFNGGYINVDAVDWPGYNDGYGYDNRNAYGYNDGFVQGTVERVDYRSGVVTIRDDRTGRFVTADVVRLDRRSSRLGLDDIRRGDYVELRGDWSRGGIFTASRIESVSARRY